MNLKSHFKYTKQERSGIFFLLISIIVLQVGYFVFCSFPIEDSMNSFSADKEIQAKINVLKEESLRKDAVKTYPFNPNFITDYKGYILGMSVKEIDRLHNFRAKNSYVNSSEDFQKVTQVSDSLLSVISPYFKFPEWTKKSEQYSVNSKKNKVERNISTPSEGLGEDVLDLNSATAKELKSVTGIGEKLSARIVKFRDRLGGFFVNEQLYDVYGLEPEVIGRVLKQFKVLKVPSIKKININSASVEELQKLIYFHKKVATGIVNYRNDNNNSISLDELIKIEDFPVDKIDRIILYLSL